MKLIYQAPNVKIAVFDTADIIQTSGVINVDTSDYGFTLEAGYTNQGQQWQSDWNN